ncbi:MAG: response regulator [Pseudomonadales bacterium]|nr:response regulator [Pseudomonadales bacterium]NRA16691.1 response regulator [Oceanospirillaceae bacterium]
MTVLRKLLIVDDERGIRKSLERNIRRNLSKDDIELDVRHAADGEECISLAKEERPDLILLDIRMPIMDGIQACGILRSNPNFDPTVIIILTAEATAEVKGLSSGADDYITKPFDMKALLLRIRQAFITSEKRDVRLKDPMTGLWTRGYLDNCHIEGEIGRAKRHHRSLSLVLFEFDPCYALKDDHASVSKIVRDLSGLITTRSSDVIARWNERTFATLLPETDEAGARIVANNFLQMISAYDSRLIPSVGISVLDPENHVEAMAAFAETSLAIARDRGEIAVNGKMPG